MTSGQNRRKPRSDQVLPGSLRRFVGNRAREAASGAFFSTVFLMCAPVHSLALDDIRVLSRLGQPLVAEIMITPAAGEVLERGCFTTRNAAGDLPYTGRLRLALSRSLSGQVLRVTTAQPLREPMSEFVLQVKCSGAPTLVRNFLVMVDPVAADEATAMPTQAVPARVTPVAARNVSRPRPGDIQPGSRYTVRAGDMLSTIADRVAGRPEWSVWPIAQQIYNSNPGAFLLGNPNMLSLGSTIYIPQLSEVDMRASTSRVRPASQRRSERRPVASAARSAATATVTTSPATAVELPDAVRTFVVEPDVDKPETGSEPVTELSIATRVSRILDAPAEVNAPAVPLQTMQLTTSLLSESRVKMEMRAQGNPVPPVVLPEPVAQRPEPAPAPQSQPDRPDSAINDDRVAVQPGQQSAGGINWLWVIVGLLTGVLLGAVAGAGLLRRHLRREYDHDLREGIQRHIQVDRMRRERDREQTEAQETDHAIPASASVATQTMELPRVEQPEVTEDYTVEVGSMPGLDFEVAEAEDSSSKTVEVAAVAEGLDLELPNAGQSGQHEVDFELLERAYSEDYNFQNENIDTETDDEPVVTNDEESFYHLENRDPADDTPLPIELGDDEMGDDDEDSEPKVVRFPR